MLDKSYYFNYCDNCVKYFTWVLNGKIEQKPYEESELLRVAYVLYNHDKLEIMEKELENKTYEERCDLIYKWIKNKKIDCLGIEHLVNCFLAFPKTSMEFLNMIKKVRETKDIDVDIIKFLTIRYET